MIKRCKFFRCDSKEVCDDKTCSGLGAEGYCKCGCSFCFERCVVGDTELCDVALCMREEEMEESE